MDLSQLRPPRGAKRDRKRIGRGNASGTGTYAGKGLKGQKARAGGMPFAGFEGGQLPLVRRLARKAGFTNAFRIHYEEVKVSDLVKLDAAEIGPEMLIAAGIVKRSTRPIKILSNGQISRAVTVRAHAFTAAARQKIEDAGGRAEYIDGDPAAKRRAARAAAAEPPPAETTDEAEAGQSSHT